MKADEDEDDEVTIGVARYPCLPSLVALQQMRNRLHMAQDGKRLMKWSAMATGRELRRIAESIEQVFKKFAEEVKNAFILLARCRYFYPNFNQMVLECVAKEACVTVETSVKGVTGVRIKLFEIIESGQDPFPNMGIEKGGQAIGEAKKAWRELLKRFIEIVELRNSFMMLDMAHSNATKKSNVLGKIIIPRTEVTIRYILSELEELEREEFFRLKKVQEVKKKRKRKAEEKNKTGKSKLCVSCSCPLEYDPYGADSNEKKRVNLQKQLDELLNITKEYEKKGIESTNADQFKQMAQELRDKLKTTSQPKKPKELNMDLLCDACQNWYLGEYKPIPGKKASFKALGQDVCAKCLEEQNVCPMCAQEEEEDLGETECPECAKEKKRAVRLKQDVPKKTETCPICDKEEKTAAFPVKTKKEEPTPCEKHVALKETKSEKSTKCARDVSYVSQSSTEEAKDKENCLVCARDAKYLDDEKIKSKCSKCSTKALELVEKKESDTSGNICGKCKSTDTIQKEDSGVFGSVAISESLATSEEQVTDDLELGVFEIDVKEIIKIVRKKNEDGTVTEERKVIRIKKETRTPALDDITDDNASVSRRSSTSSRNSRITRQSSNASNNSKRCCNKKTVGMVTVFYPKKRRFDIVPREVQSCFCSETSPMGDPVTRYCMSTSSIVPVDHIFEKIPSSLINDPKNSEEISTELRDFISSSTEFLQILKYAELPSGAIKHETSQNESLLTVSERALVSEYSRNDKGCEHSSRSDSTLTTASNIDSKNYASFSNLHDMRKSRL